MKIVKSYAFKPKYKRDNGLVVLDSDSLPLPDGFDRRETTMVLLPAGQVAGNHKHPRQEAYLCLNKQVELHWVDEAGMTYIEQMVEEGNDPKLFVIPAFVPHAVVNKGEKDVTLLGYADDSLTDVEPAEVVNSRVPEDVGLPEQEVTLTARLLSKLKPGFLPFDIFHQVTRLVATPIIEVVPLRRSPNGKVEILLLKREADDPVWPGQLHVPGTVVRASDTPGSFDEALGRVLNKELVSVTTSKPVFVKNILHFSGRGMEVSQIFWTEIQGEPVTGEFYEPDDLPQTIVKSQLDFIPDAVAHFRDVRP
jgi:uncharacterized RmlC-like cupin family protein